MQTKSLYASSQEISDYIAVQLATVVTPPLIIYLKGDLGTGKTTFTRAFLNSLGFEDAVKSPTFTLVESYSLKGWDIYHFDLYRLTPDEIPYLGFEDYCHKNSICLIEWPEHGENYLPPADIILRFNYQLPGRHLTIEGNSQAGDEMITKIEV